MAQKFGDKIFIVDEKTKNHIKQIPAYRKIAENFELVDMDSINKRNFVERLFDKTNMQVLSNKTPIPLHEYNKIEPLIRSELYGNKYYPLFEYTNALYEELAELMAILCNFMGDNVNFSSEFYEENWDCVETDDTMSGELEGKYKMSKVDATTKLSKKSSQKEEKGKWIKFETKVENAKKTPKELDKYINDNKINLEALPPSFKILVKTYKESPNAILKSYEYEIDTIQAATNYLKICKDFSIDADVMKVFKADFKLNLNSQSSCLHKVKTKIRHSVTFNEKR